MKRFIAVVSAVSCMLLAGALIAQPPEGGRGRGGRGMRGGGQAGRVGQVLKDLDLKPEQQTKIDEITKKMREEMDKVRADSGITTGTQMRDMDPEKRRALFEKMSDVSKKSMEEISAVLTPEQKTKFEEKMKEMPAFGRRGRGQRGQEGQAPPEQKAPEQKTE